MKVLVTGGAGYVGSHTAQALVDGGHKVVVLDNLSQGRAAYVPDGATLVQGDLHDPALVADTFAAHQPDAVLHFAALSLVGESMQRPWHYFRQNVGGAITLLEAASAAGVRRFILSSTANLFGEPQVVPITESEVIAPGSPYGESKYIIERMLHWAHTVAGMHYACLRYFNAAGADPLGRRGEWHQPETHLIPIILQVAAGQRAAITVFGDDYATPDGTCIRDYVHVCDLADAHVLALAQLDNRNLVLNLGNGLGYSVMEVIESARRVTGHPIPVVRGERRAGDPPVLVAASDEARRLLGWSPRFAALDDIMRTAWDWHRHHPNG